MWGPELRIDLIPQVMTKALAPVVLLGVRVATAHEWKNNEHVK